MTFEIAQLCDIDVDVIDGDRGKNYPHQDELLESGYCLFLSAKNVTQNGFLFADNQFITQEKDGLLNNGKLNRGDIVITTRGTVGNVAIYSDDVPYRNIRINSGMLIIRCGENIDNYYLYQVLRSKWFYNQILSIQSGSAQPQLPKSHFLKMTIPMPDIDTQHKIAIILSGIGDKINVNTAINENLEQQAHALFKAWFVDFEPFGGVMPYDWNVGIVSDLSKEIICGKTPSTKKKEYYGNFMPFITIPDMHNCVYAISTERYLSELGAKSQSKKTLPKNSICVSCIGTAGLVVLVAVDSQTNQQINSIIPKDGYSPYYIYLFMQTLSEKINRLGQSGSTIVNLNKAQFGIMEALVPSIVSMNEFDSIVQPLFKLILANQQENQRLSAIRDTLLPKLMNGEIDVSAVKI